MAELKQQRQSQLAASQESLRRLRAQMGTTLLQPLQAECAELRLEMETNAREQAVLHAEHMRRQAAHERERSLRHAEHMRRQAELRDSDKRRLARALRCLG